METISYNAPINAPINYCTSSTSAAICNLSSNKTRMYYDGVDITEIVEEKANEMKKEAIRREEAKPKPKPKDPIVNVDFNMSLDRTTIKWTDGSITQIHCHALDEFDKEKAIALCFMKKMYDNRGCYNDFLNHWVKEASIH